MSKHKKRPPTIRARPTDGRPVHADPYSVILLWTAGEVSVDQAALLLDMDPEKARALRAEALRKAREAVEPYQAAGDA